MTLVFCFSIVLALAYYALQRLGRGWTFKVLLKDFNRKMWMTFGLGFLFFSAYFLIVVLGAQVIRQWGTDFFFLVYRHPIAFIYGGLWLFVFLSLSIYFARILIKYLYLTRGKDG